MINEERISKLTSAVYKVTDLFADKEPLKFAIRRACLDVLSLHVSYIENKSLEAKKKIAQKGISQSRIILKYLSLASHQEWINPKNFEILEHEYFLVLEWFSSQQIKNQEAIKNIRQSKKKDIIKDQISNDSILNSNKEIDNSSENSKLLEQSIIFPSISGQTTGINTSSIFSKVSPEQEIKPKSNLYDIDIAINYEELSDIQLKILEILQTKKFLKAGELCSHFEGLSDRSIRREIKELRDNGIILTKGSGRATYYQLNSIY